ncbi:MAG: dihydroorotase [Candidatus Njordarchaeia archaeon]
MSQLKISNAKILIGDKIVEGSVYIEDGKIVKVGRETKLPKADITLNARGKLLIPGIFDAHVHFREPGFAEKEDFYSGSCAAAAGGVTTVMDMPNTNPPTNTFTRFKEKVRLGESKSIVDFSLHFGYPRRISDLVKVYEFGASSIKIYYYDLESPIKAVKDLIEYIEKENLDLILTFHAEDRDIISKNEKKYANINKRSLDYHYFVRSPDAESEAVAKILDIAYGHNVPIHFCHISTRLGLMKIMEKMKKGMNVSFEVTPHHILLSHRKFRYLGPIIKVNPPIRSKKDADFLLSNIDKIQIIASDHAPHTATEKLYGLFDITKAPSGIIGVETMLPLLLTVAKKLDYSLPKMIKKLTFNPAKRFGFRKGVIAEGYDADLVLVDLKQEWRIEGSKLHGKTKFTPYEGFEVVGKVLTTIVRGEIVYDHGECVGKKGWGKFVKKSNKILMDGVNDVKG